MDTWILRMCRRTCLWQLMTWVFVAVVGIVLMVANLRYFTNFLSGPFTMGVSELDSVKDPTQSSKYFVHVTGMQAIDLGIQQFSVNKRGETEVGRIPTAGFYALNMGGKILVVKTSSARPLSVEGELIPIPFDLDRLLFDTPEMEELRDRFYSFYLDTGSFRTMGYVSIVLWIAFLGVAGWKAVPVWRNLQNLSQHPIVKRIALWGDLVQLSIEIERESMSPDVRRQDSWILTQNYLIKSSHFSFAVPHLRFGQV